MEKAKRKKQVLFFLTLFALLTGIPTAALAVIFAIKLKYALMIIFFAVSMHGIWGGGFYYIAYSKIKITLRCIEGMEQGKKTPEELSDHTGLKPEAVTEILKYSKRKKYI